MTRETLDRLARELAVEVPLPVEDWDAIVSQADRMLTLIRSLDELPLQDVEPASCFRIPSERGGA
jgi:hypothetical protein